MTDSVVTNPVRLGFVGNDKPDLRNPVEISDVTEVFRGGGFAVFAKAIEDGSVVRAICYLDPTLPPAGTHQWLLPVPHFVL